MNNLLTLKEAAEYLGISKMTLRRWANNKIIPFIRINKRGDRRFAKEDIENFIEDKNRLADDKN